MDFIYSYIQNICVFTLVTTLILNIFPDKRYKKYIKLFVGLLLLALIFNPIIKFKNAAFNINEIISMYSRGKSSIDLDKDVEELETKIYERMSNEYKEDNGN